ncbi:ABC transporter permease [Corticicoccus populi]|uniref:ABC transporter permease n=1 Tax=Corticicoccus populi TaxID=1812821 RepID=A0ABW5WV34_9STAP
MRILLETRWLLVRHKVWKLLLWLVLPLLLTVLLTTVINRTSDDFRIPVAVIAEDEGGEMTADVIEALIDSEYMDVEIFDESMTDSVLHSMEQYEFDSVFIIPEDFEENIEDGVRRNIVETYYTDRSLFYDPVKEVAASVIQGKLGELYAVEQIFDMKEIYAPDSVLEEAEVIQQIEQTERETNLVTQSFELSGEEQIEETEGVNPVHIWAYLSLLFALFMFDFIVNERKEGIYSRFISMRWTYKTYLIFNMLLYTAVMMVFDWISFLVFSLIFDTSVNFVPLLCFRLALNMAALVTALLSKSLIGYYRTAILMTAVLIGIEILLPLIRVPYILDFHIIVSFINGGMNLFWLLVLSCCIFIWKRRGV